NFWKEILPFLPKKEPTTHTDTSDDCSDILVVTDLPMSLWLGTRNALIHSHFDLCKETEVTLLLHIYLIKARLPSGLSFTTYTYAGELPSCAFGFNSNGLAFTLNSVPPTEEEIMVGGIGRNFVSRDLLEATTLDDSLSRIHSAEASVGHSYNLIDMKTRKLLNVETASRKRMSVLSVGSTPFFHANMYLHLQVQQTQDENSMNRQRRVAQLPKKSNANFLSLLGDTNDKQYPIYMEAPNDINFVIVPVNVFHCEG
ncbi:hypothetical protein IFM89_021477, partial [Coptis chinensis]